MRSWWRLASHPIEPPVFCWPFSRCVCAVQPCRVHFQPFVLRLCHLYAVSLFSFGGCTPWVLLGRIGW